MCWRGRYQPRRGHVPSSSIRLAGPSRRCRSRVCAAVSAAGSSRCLAPFARGGPITTTTAPALAGPPATESACGGAAPPKRRAQWAALVLAGLILDPVARRSGQRRAWHATADRRHVEGVAHAFGGLLRHLDKREAVVDVDVANAVAGNMRLIGNRADDIGRADAILTAQADEESRHARRAALGIAQ